VRVSRFRVALAAGLLALLIAPIAAGQINWVPKSTALAQTSGLPALPSRWPSTLQLGLSDSPGGAATMRSTANYGFRYQYLAGGVNTGNGWANWNANGGFATNYIQESIQNGIVPVFTYYMLFQSRPGGSSESSAVATNLQNTSTMSAYYNDLKLFFQRASAFPNHMVVLHVEPDAWGYIQQRSTGDSAASVPVQVASTGLAELAGLPNNASGFARAIDALRDRYAPNVVLGYHVSVWGTGNDILYSNPPNSTVESLATRSANFFLSLNGGFDVAFAEFGDRDAEFKRVHYGDGGAAWWDAGDFSRNQLFIGRFVSLAQKRVVFWQIPFGNTRMRAMNNTWNHYQDNHVEWLLDDATRNNMRAYVERGVVAFLFGRGADGATCACDANRDGVTNPAPINGNTGVSLNADDDGGFFRQKSVAYYAAGAISLSGGSPPLAAATPTRTPTLRPVNTPTPTPTAQAANIVIDFDNASDPGRTLNGQYPTGVANWGTNAWYLSRPWKSFTTNSVSFNGVGRTSASVSFPTGRSVISLQAFNGGAGSTTITAACPGQPTRTLTLAANQLSTLITNWSGTCSSLTLTSTNGWDTNFDRFVLR
jgi:hypothetical protein